MSLYIPFKDKQTDSEKVSKFIKILALVVASLVDSRVPALSH